MLIILSLIFTTPIIFILLIYEFLGIIINFECVNLQNYNLCRLSDERIIKTFDKIKERQQREFKLNMSEGSKVIYNSFIDTIDIPDVDTVISHINTREEAIQLLDYARKQIKNNQIKKELKK